MAAIHLRYDLMVANMDCAEMRHAQTVMRELGITYQHASPQSLGEQWWFWNCENVPTELPPFLTQLNLDPKKCVGWGLSQQDADKIAAWSSSRGTRP